MNAKTARQKRIAQHDHDIPMAVRLTFFEFTEPKAKAVHLAGSFNGWQPELTSMTCLGGGFWTKELYLHPGRYEYRIVVDGEWIPDLHADNHAQNPFGGINSVLTISGCQPAKRRTTRRSSIASLFARALSRHSQQHEYEPVPLSAVGA